MTHKIKSAEKKQICSICGKEYEGYGNNAQPVNNGRCCDECNDTVVIPTRIHLIRMNIKKRKLEG